MPSNSKQLLAELAVEIARRLREIFANDAPSNALPGYFYHLHTGDFERACNFLWQLDCAVAGYGTSSKHNEIVFADAKKTRPQHSAWPPFFRVFSSEEIRQQIAQTSDVKLNLHIEDSLCSYLAMAGDYGPEEQLLSLDRKPFVPPEPYEQGLHLLAEHGYAGKIGKYYIWTDKIAPAMHTVYAWTEDGQPWGEVEDARLENEARAAWETMPLTIKKALFQHPHYNLMDTIDVLMKFWKDGTWSQKPEDETQNLGGELHLARRLIEIAKAETQP